MADCAENYTVPAYKWIGSLRRVRNAHGMEICNFPGGIGFWVRNYSRDKQIIVLLNVYREDGACEQYIMRAYYVEQWNDGEKWQTHQLVLYPYESLHGMVNVVTFAFLVHREGQVIPSEFQYKFARREDFFREYVEPGDFHEHHFKSPNYFCPWQHSSAELQQALHTLYGRGASIPIRPFFTHGDPGSPDHPRCEIHRCFDRVLEMQSQDPHGRHFVHLAVFNFENEDMVSHLLHLQSRGIQIECVGGWEQTSSADWSWQVARLRKAGIPVYGIVRNTPYSPGEGIASMHTKIIVFDGQMCTSSSYNLDFHRWGHNWENGLFFYSSQVSLLYEHIFQVIKGAVFRSVQIHPEAGYNLFYSFGSYYNREGRVYTAQDALLREIHMARSSIFISMFDLEDFYLKGTYGESVSLIKALADAHYRGVYIVIHLNGFKAEGEDSSAQGGEFRPLKPVVQRLMQIGIDVLLVYNRDNHFSALHHKFAVFDEETVISESYNWYSASLYSDEVFSVIRDRNLAGEFIKEMYLMLRSFRIRRGKEIFI